MWQNINVTEAGQYYFKITWMPAIDNPLGKGFAVYFNTTQVAQITATDSLYEDHVEEVLVNLTTGILDLDLEETGPINDYNGTFVGSIELSQLLEIPFSETNNTYSN